jgi:GTP-binding protein Era
MSAPETTAPRTGHVAVIGRPNVGKSTLVNALVGYKVSIVSSKAQTTRHRILGVSTRAEGQIVYVDTPGLHDDGKRAINRYMNRAARGALVDVALVALVIEAGQWREADERAWQAVRDSGIPRVLVINKVDRIADKSELLPFIAEVTREREFAAVIPVSAEKGVGLDDLERRLLSLLPEGEPAFGEDDVTDRSERFLVSELVREQLMRQLGEELPYSGTVAIEQYEDEGKLLRIAATIWVERDGQKAIVVGAGGARIRSIGTAARIAIEAQLERKVFLQLWCKVRDGWSDDEAALRRFGYND